MIDAVMSAPGLQQTPTQTTLTVQSRRLAVPASQIFTYPNRFGNPWEPSVQAFASPAESIEPVDFELEANAGSTNELGFEIVRSLSREALGKKRQSFSHRVLRKLYDRGLRTVGESIEVPSNQSVFDTRDDIFLHDGNIAHILCNTLPLLLQLREQCGELTVVLRKRASKMARTIYQLMGFETIYTDRAVTGRILCGKAHNQQLQLWKVGCFGSQFDFMLDRLPDIDTPEKIFIARRGSRALVNDAEVEAFLTRRGFEKIYCEDFSLLEQWAIARQAKAVVAVHGAAMANLAFNRNGARVIELMHPGYATRLYRRCLSALNSPWCGVTGQMPENLIRDLEIEPKPRQFAELNLNVHIDSISAALDYLEL